MPIAGIACDNHKLDKFKKELDKKRFKYKVQNGVTNDTKIIKVICLDFQVKDLQKICNDVETYFHNQKIKNN